MTRVAFRKFPEGDVVALFPDEEADFDGNILSYQRVGQHGAASPDLMTELEPASELEYIDLYEELENAGYNLEVIP